MRELYHYGVKRRSGRYPWGSGERPYQSSGGKIPSAFFIKKGTELHRVTNATETDKLLDKNLGRRIYVSRSDLDDTAYTLAMKNLPSYDEKSGMRRLALTAEKDLAVLPHEAVYKDIVERCAKQKVSDLKAEGDANVEWFMNDPRYKKLTISQAVREMENDRFYVRNSKIYGRQTMPTYNNIMASIMRSTYGSSVPREVHEAFLNRYKKMGFDAIEDSEDRFQGFESPLIILDPDNTIRVKKVREIW